MNKNQLVKLEFINKRNELKKVQFYMEKHIILITGLTKKEQI